MIMNSAVKFLEMSFESYPQRPSVEDDRGVLSFYELRHMAMAVASRLLSEAQEASPVLVYLPKSTDCVVSFMAALYSGNPYVPVDSDIPANRLEKIIEGLCPGYIITNDALAEKLPDELGSASVIIFNDRLLSTPIDEQRIDHAVNSVIDTDPIYIMYTSGSTGSPKGVTVSHRGVIDYTLWLCHTFGFDENTVMANQAAFYFDNSVFDIYGCLCCGGKMVIIPQNLILYPSKLPSFLAEKEITSIFWVPTVMISVANSGALSGCRLPKLKTVAFCGEVMPNLQLNIWRRELPDCVYANLYGPTEITDVCSYYIADREFDDAAPLPIGKACENKRIIILTEQGRIAEPMEQGELCVSGSGVALGYWNSPEISDRVFVQNPANTKYSERIYKTGDLAYVNQEGLIIFLGRRDSQIKLRGNRIELGDIEAAAVCIDGVDSACALFDGEEIVLFIETKQEFIPRRFNMLLKKYVPSYMLPGRLISMEKLPHTSNDKIDRVTLGKLI